MRNDFFRDRDFLSTLFKLWFPIALQQLIFSLLNFFTGMMIGQLGETSVAAVGLANQILFLFQLLLFGIGSGAAIFIAQFWGKQDIKNIRRVLGICLSLGLTGAAGFSIIALLFPEHAIAIYSTDRAVIALGGEYLRITGLSYIAIAISTSYAVTLRSTGNIRLPVAISVFALSLGAAINYALIFGHFGLPTLGVQGSAVGTALARWIECALLLSMAYTRSQVVNARLGEMLSFDRAFLFSILKTVLPVVINEIAWSVGISAYNLIYGRIGTESVAAVSIAATIENLALVPFVGMANAAAIMIGNRIGADEEHKAFDYAKRFLLIVLTLGVFVGSFIFFGADRILEFYKIDETTRQFARNILTVTALALWIKAGNMMFVVGVLRAGGDARACLVIDVGPLWLVGLPLAFTGAFVFGLPVYWVFLLTISDEATKFVIAAWRVVSKKWINNLARHHAPVEA